jgi:hypothetical protein
MYWRYFMWNFAGRQNDAQGHGNIEEGNWLSGVDFVDEQRLGNRERLPESQKNNRAFNRFYFLPLLLGLFGLVFQLLKAPKDFTVLTLLFLLTGLAIVVYLNQYPLQPRERDYAYSGSFYAFSLWIGLGVYALYYAATRLSMKDLGKISLIAFGSSTVLFLFEIMAGGDHNFSLAIFYLSSIGVLAMLLLIAFGNVLQRGGVKAAFAGLLAMTVPAVMAAEGWDDHNRSKRRTAVDFAKNYLNSLEKNAILFTNGDNDTFPLWYVQEVEGYRTDVRIVNMSLLNTDWYIDQLKRKAYDSDPVPFSMEEQKYRQGTRDIILLDKERNKYNDYIDLGVAMDVALDDSKQQGVGGGKKYNFIPTRKFRLPVDSAFVMSNGTVRPQDSANVVSALEWEINRSYILKSNLMVLDLLLNNNWERPIYFAVTTGPDTYMGLESYFQLEGLAYRLVPVKYPKNPKPNVVGGIASDIMYDNVMNDFLWGNMDDTTDGGIYMDENNRRMTNNFRLQFSNLADQLRVEGKDSLALNILHKSLEVMPEKNVPYDRVLLFTIEGLFDSGDSLTAGKLANRLFSIMEDELQYYFTLEPEFAAALFDEYDLKFMVNSRIEQLVSSSSPKSELAKELSERLDVLFDEFELKKNEMKSRKIGSPLGR